MHFVKAVFCVLALWFCVMMLSSCQTVQGMGKDVANLGKSTKNTQPLPAAVPAAPTVVAPPAAKPAPKKETSAKNMFHGIWEGLTKPLEHISMPALPWGSKKSAQAGPAHPKVSLNDLDPSLVKKQAIKEEAAVDSMVLEDIPARADIQEIPTPPADYWKGAEAVDVNGDGVPDVRYRQRN